MNVQIEWVYSQKKSKAVTFRSAEYLSLDQALLLAEDLERTGRLQQITFIDEQDRAWNTKELKKLTKHIEKEPSNIIAYFDGSYNKDTGEAGLGIVIYYQLNKDEYRIRANVKVHELTSNNEAEYAAFSLVMEQLAEMKVQSQTVTFKGDSQVVLKQLEGEWPCYEEVFIKWLDKIEARIKALNIYPIYHPILRNDNSEADKLSKQAIQNIEIKSQIKIE
ncbi:reverse transcriptase-like protein [Bacillus sp. IB182487]|uniref:Reverse transcriptase-like protein n=1 Tax=Metabacillus arenae TaxID=2771434 RepID=A0A926NJC8_9BACI|nr:reverse transcriptase-like protein [Metabacillus arenae]